MALDDALDRYFNAWNAHDPDGVVAALTDGGTYEDPTTGGPITGAALAASVAALVEGFPDLRFEIVSVAPMDATTAAAQWRMLGTNTGAMPMGPPTGGSVDLAGADFLEYDPDTDRISKVVGYFDSATMLTQLGLQAHLSPPDLDPFLKFGLGVRVDTGRATVPGAFTVTWIEIEAQDAPVLQQATEKIIVEQLENPGYLGSCIVTVGKRNATFSAWESVEAAESALGRGAHAQAMRLARDGGIGDGARGLTSIWRPERLNHVVVPAQGGSSDLSELDGQWL
jgi:steroid delta-isomerase-like uncharacterized protein